MEQLEGNYYMFMEVAHKRSVWPKLNFYNKICVEIWGLSNKYVNLDHKNFILKNFLHQFMSVNILSINYPAALLSYSLLRRF